jgi:hypothetical protein
MPIYKYLKGRIYIVMYVDLVFKGHGHMLLSYPISRVRSISWPIPCILYVLVQWVF